jgi:hypothetical protein
MRTNVSSASTRKRQDGVATVIMLILVALVLSFIVANIATLSALHNDVKRIEQRQLRRLHSVTPSASTNSPTAQPAK